MADVTENYRLTLLQLLFGTTGGIHLFISIISSFFAFVISAAASEPTSTLKFQAFILFIIFASELATLALSYLDCYQLLPVLIRQLHVIIVLHSLGVFFTFIIGLVVISGSDNEHLSHRLAGLFCVFTGLLILYKLYIYVNIYRRQGLGPMEKIPLD